MKDLFGEPIKMGKANKRGVVKRYPNLAHSHPLNRYGITNGSKCKDCIFCFKRGAGSRDVYKCVFYDTNSSASDIRLKYTACELFKDSTDWVLFEEFCRELKPRIKKKYPFFRWLPNPSIHSISITIFYEIGETKVFHNENEAIAFVRSIL